jgi:hypothetical protein
VSNSASFVSIVEKYFYRNGGWVRLKGELTVYYWPRIAGVEIAKKVQAIRYRDGYLYLQTEIPALAQQILLMIPSFLERYQKVVGKKVLRGIKVKVGSIKHEPDPDPPPNLTLDQSELQEIASCKSEICDPELATKFGEFMQKAYVITKNQKAVGGRACMSCGVIIDAAFDYCPCCEQKVNEEINAFLQYQQKINPELKDHDPSKMAGLSHLRIKNSNE